MRPQSDKNMGIQLAEVNQPRSSSTKESVVSSSFRMKSDVLSQFKANLHQVQLLQKKMQFLTREVDSLVKPRN